MSYCSSLILSSDFHTYLATSLLSTVERCTYVGEQHVLVNESQSPGITCTSLNLHGSSYYHKLDGMSTNENQMDIIHCEAASEGYQDLDLYHEVSRDGTRSSRISSGACMIGDGVTCTQVILYVNLTFYDLRNGSVIPVCAFNIRNDHNSECYCIHYLTIGKTSTYSSYLLHHTYEHNIVMRNQYQNQYVHIGRQLDLICYDRGTIIDKMKEEIT